MKKRLYLAAIAMCVMLTAGCGEEKNTDKTTAKQETTKEAGQEKTKEAGQTEDASEAPSRLVSVENLEKYITLGEYKGIVLNKTVAEVSDKDVENLIHQNLKSAAETVSDSKETVQEGDIATISFVGKKDGVAFDGGSSGPEGYDLLIGSGTMIPGFEEGIVGMKKGETREVPLTFPEDYNNAELAGADTVFEITVQSFKRPPELTEDWVSANTDYATVEEYQEYIRQQLQDSAESQAKESLANTAWTTVYENSEVMEYPQEDIDAASEKFRQLAENYAASAGMEVEAYVTSQGVSMEEFEEQSRQYAEAEVKQLMIIQAIMDAEGMTLEDEESLAIQDQFVQNSGAGSLEKLVEMYSQPTVNRAVGTMRVQEFLIANANIEEAPQETEETSEEKDTAEEETVSEEDKSETKEDEEETEDAEKSDSEKDDSEKDTEKKENAD